MDYTLIGGGWIAPTNADAEVTAMMAEWNPLLIEAAELAQMESDERPEVVARRRAVVSAARRLHQGFARHSAPAPLGRYAGAEAGLPLAVLGVGATLPLRALPGSVEERGDPTELILGASLKDWGRELPTPAEYMAALQTASLLCDMPTQPLDPQVAEAATRVYEATKHLGGLIKAGMEYRPYRLEYALIRFFVSAEAWPLGMEDKQIADEVFLYEEFYTWELRFPPKTPRRMVEAARENAVGLNTLLSMINLHKTLPKIT
jgi:hypothetical protein